MLSSHVIGSRQSELRLVADPRPVEDQLVVEVLASGVCTSDQAPWRHGASPSEPVRLGHEVVGRVLELGPRATGVSVGDRVTGLADQGFSERVLMLASETVRLPEGVPAHLALGEPLADLIEALDRCPSASDARVAVVGLGFMGLGLVQLLRDALPAYLVGVDRAPSSRERGLANGCDDVYSPDDLPGGFADSSSKVPGHEQRFDLVIEATGVDAGLTTAGLMVRPYGTLCVVGYHHSGTALMDMSLWSKGATIINGFGPDRARKTRAMRRGLRLIEAGRFDYRPLITHTLEGLERIDDAYRLMESRDPGFVKAVIVR